MPKFTSPIHEHGTPGDPNYPHRKGGKPDALSYPSLKARDFKVSKGEAAIVMKRTVAAQKALDALNDAVSGDGESFGEEIEVVNQAMGVLRRRLIPRALLKVQEDEEPLFDDD
jgi:hypothetical protein